MFLQFFSEKPFLVYSLCNFRISSNFHRHAYIMTSYEGVVLILVSMERGDSYPYTVLVANTTYKGIEHFVTKI